MKDLEVYPPGTSVVLTLSNFSGIVEGIYLDGNDPTYEITYFTGTEYQTRNFHECDFTLQELTQKQLIGFKGEEATS